MLVVAVLLVLSALEPCIKRPKHPNYSQDSSSHRDTFDAFAMPRTFCIDLVCIPSCSAVRTDLTLDAFPVKRH